MKVRIGKQLNKGFILFITLMMLIIFAVLGLSLYQQTTMSTLNVQYVTFKQEAEDLALKALNAIETQVRGSTYSKRELCGEFEMNADGTPKKDAEGKPILLEKAWRCDPILDQVINDALTELRDGGGLTGGSTNIAGWNNLVGQAGMQGSFSQNGEVYYIVQQLGKDSQNIGYLLFRITIIARVLDTYSVISAVSAIPENP